MKFQKSGLSPEAEIVWEEIGERQRRIIRKDYPLRKDRDDAIRELSARGVKVPILAELTGLSRAQIIRIRKTILQPVSDGPNIITLPLKEPVKIFEHSIIVIPD